MAHSRLRTLPLLTLCATCFLSFPAIAEDAAKTPWNHWEYGNSSLEFHGYLRSTVGTDFDGHDMAYFKAPGATSKYRLGNESDVGLETQLDYRYFLDGIHTQGSRYIQLSGMLANYQDSAHYDKFTMRLTDSSLQQSYIRLGNVLGDGGNIWFGRRYYDRRDIHMDDHFWLNVGQNTRIGGGLEGLRVGGPGRLDLALFQARDRNIADLNAGPEVGDLDTYTLDARYRDVPTNPDGLLTLWGQLAKRPSNSNIGYSDRYGYAIGGWHEQSKVYDGRLINALTYRSGAAVVQSDFNPRAGREDQGYDLSQAYIIETNADYFYETPDKTYGIQWIAVARREDHGDSGVAGGDTINWLSTGVRPVFALNEYFSIAPELGVDYINNTTIGREGFLGKGTLALQFSDQPGYFNRPVARAFVTGAAWSNDLKGAIGNAPGNAAFGNNQHGVTFGIQLESWW